MRNIWICLLVLMLGLPSAALTDDQNFVLDKVEEFYKSVGMKDRAAWLARQRKLKRISFEVFTGDEVGASAITDPSDKTIRINGTAAHQFKDANYAGLAMTLSHERVHQDQSSLGIMASKLKQAAGFGNKAEQEGWAEGLKVGRDIVMELRKKLAKAKSARDKIILGKKLEAAAHTWKVLLDEWNVAKKNYGDFPATEFQDKDGMILTVEDMLAESVDSMKVAKDNYIPASAMVKPYSGRYNGRASGGAVGTFNFVVGQDYNVRGAVAGTHKMGSFKGTLDGRVNADGILSGKVYGSIKTSWGVEKFSGSFSGRMSGNRASGKWQAGAEGVYPSGSWAVQKR